MERVMKRVLLLVLILFIYGCAHLRHNTPDTPEKLKKGEQFLENIYNHIIESNDIDFGNVDIRISLVESNTIYAKTIVTRNPNAIRPDKADVVFDSQFLSRLCSEAHVALLMSHEIGHLFIIYEMNNRVVPLEGDMNEEFRADSLAVEFAAEAGYHPHAYIDYLRGSENATRKSYVTLTVEHLNMKPVFYYQLTTPDRFSALRSQVDSTYTAHAPICTELNVVT